MPKRDKIPALHAQWETVMMIVATFATGIIDAVGYLGFDKIFTANMTGNVIVLGMGLAGNDELPVMGPLIALAAFFIGALLCGRLLRNAEGGWSRPVRRFFLVEAIILLCAGLILLRVRLEPDSSVLYIFTFIVACVLGGQASAARKVGVKDVTTVVVTSTITGLASDSRMAGGAGQRSARKIAAVASIIAGATVGGLLHRIVGDGWGVIATALVLFAMLAADAVMTARG
ncbi:YoaK family protein [Bifidobacterium psychraerophilum]|jgi:uncharacterized membrane protein YoaK (UPF0700 family)|uniref:Succinate dehydrogenase flavoprotein subunit n=1 Tax=Bifidobacterium psychraerophilum TaxID=218140 RepID=A0A087CI42_9BIFI|nr:YoaK family protein [Bifidobacterium psychraerophilum]KFI82942.1 succinate dehydrogenase flavoprotein subunit [Bifidobacterium psychraerophilum]PKA94690.1 uncharacterized membrane protein YoaK (UPF0700 family) [Bifidobacterium psychraerophilum DSM 22366]